MNKVFSFIGKITVGSLVVALLLVAMIHSLNKEMEIQYQKIQAEENYWNEYDKNNTLVNK